MTDTLSCKPAAHPISSLSSAQEVPSSARFIFSQESPAANADLIVSDDISAPEQPSQEKYQSSSAPGPGRPIGSAVNHDPAPQLLNGGSASDDDVVENTIEDGAIVLKPTREQ